MELSPSQSAWLRTYEEAKKRGGAYNSGSSEWVDIEDIPVPDWYKEYLGGEDEVEEVKQAASFDISEYFRNNGKKGGLATRQKGREYYSRIGKMGGRGKKKMVE